jgi:hypothetical protein
MLKMLRKKGPTLFVMPSEARNDKINYFLCSLFSLRGVLSHEQKQTHRLSLCY